MNCNDARRELTAYLDGELVDARGSAVRGHLRECAACRDVSSAESTLRDGLRDLPPVDPPASLWAGVQAQLAAAEVGDARRPAWRRFLARFTPVMPRPRDLAFGGMALAAAVTFVIWRAHGRDAENGPRPSEVAHQSAEFGAAGSQASVPPIQIVNDDVTADLADEPAQLASTYSQAAQELLELAMEARARWPQDQQVAFDQRRAELDAGIATSDGRARITAERALVRFLQNAAVRDEVALAGGAR